MAESGGSPQAELRAIYDRINPAIDAAIDAEVAPRPRFLNIGIDAHHASPAARDAAARFGARFSERDQPALLFAAHILEPCELDGADVVEFGAGRGGNLLVAQLLGAPRAMFAVDLTTAGFSTTRADSNGSIRPIQAAAEHSPLRAASVDLVLSIEASAYVPNVVDLYREAHRVLRPGGQFVLHVPSWTQAGRRRHLRALRHLGFDVLGESDVTEGYTAAFRTRQAIVGGALDGTTFGTGMDLMSDGTLRSAVLYLRRSDRPPAESVRGLPDESASARRALSELLDRRQVTGLF
jgi:SAM-dependent methyltransferase